jgi:signal transduction histidine kinase
MLLTLYREFWPLLLVLPLTVLALYLGVNRGLLPLNNLAQQISRRKPGLLDPVATEGVPTEVAGVVDAINRLLVRLEYALEGERRFTANAAHELMTPLAAIKTEVQLCQKQLGEDVGESMLKRIGQRVDRASHSVEQLLVLARLDPDSALPDTTVDLRGLLQQVLLDTAHLAADRDLQVDLPATDRCDIRGREKSLAILLSNLLVNAFRYATRGSRIEISLEGEQPVTLAICNACNTLSSEEFSRLTERFYRVPGSDGPGTGLGLSIVSRIVEQHGARLEIGPGEDGSGFCARIRFLAV